MTSIGIAWRTILGVTTWFKRLVKDPEKLPKHLLADEKVTWLNGEEVVIATTVGDDCVLGASVALGIDTPNLTEAYQHFKDEAQQLDPDVSTRNRQHRWLGSHSKSLAQLVSTDYHHRVLPARFYQNP